MSLTKIALHRTFGVDIAAHGDLTGTQLNPDANLEVISLGLPRTGTTSLQAALTKLCFAPSHQGVDLFRSPARTEAFSDLFSKVISGTWKAGDPILSARLRELMRGYRSSTDAPIHFFAPETYAAYPDAKYILTTRPGGKHEWFKSLWDATNCHFRRDYVRYIFRFLIWPVGFIRRTDDKVQQYHELRVKKFGAIDADLYDKHSAEVQRIVPADQLLVYDVREG